VKRAKDAAALALAALLLVANLAQAIITPRPIEGAEEAANEAIGPLAFLGQIGWAILTLGLTTIGAGRILKRLWVEEDMLQRVLLSTAMAGIIVLNAAPWIIISIRPEATFVACVLRGWLGFALNAFC